MSIKHLSASSLSLFKSAPSLWVGKYLMGWKDSVGPSAWRGSAVEAGLDLMLYKSPGQPHAKALERFELDAQGDASEEVDKHRKLLPAFLAQAAEATAEMPIPTGRQFKIEYRGLGLDWPILGYLDYLYEDFSFDLKTTERLPSEPRPEHIMGQAIYAAATERPARLLYVTPKKFAWYDVTPEMQAAGLKEAERIGRNIQAMLKLSDDPRRLLAALPMDFENFRWNDELKKTALEALAA